MKTVLTTETQWFSGTNNLTFYGSKREGIIGYRYGRIFKVSSEITSVLRCNCNALRYSYIEFTGMKIILIVRTSHYTQVDLVVL